MATPTTTIHLGSTSKVSTCIGVGALAKTDERENVAIAKKKRRSSACRATRGTKGLSD
jgi:hypothetical protein